MSKKYYLTITAVFIFLGLMHPAFADTENERSTLARILHELKAIEPLINEAQKQQPRYERLAFNYKKLRDDIHSIEEGIQQKLNETYIEPRQFAPIAGDYVDQRSIKQ